MYFISYDITPNHQRLPWIPWNTAGPSIPNYFFLRMWWIPHLLWFIKLNTYKIFPHFPREFDGKWGYPVTIFSDIPSQLDLSEKGMENHPLPTETQSTDTNFWSFPSSIATTSQLQKPFWAPIFVQEDSKFAEILDLLLSIIAGRQLLHRTSSRIRRIVTLVMSAKCCFFVPKLCEWMDAFFGTIHVERSQLTAGIGM